MSKDCSSIDIGLTLNQFEVPAIVRRPQATIPDQPGGEILLTAATASNQGQVNVFCWSKYFECCFWCMADDVLLLKEYLQRQPLHYFWALAMRETTGTTPQWLAYIDEKKNGGVPFRFESEGELRYYMTKNEINPLDYILVEFRG